jgi:hypothetical protein
MEKTTVGEIQANAHKNEDFSNREFLKGKDLSS